MAKTQQEPTAPVPQGGPLNDVITVTLSQKQRSAIAVMAPDITPVEAMSGIATALLQDMADGGMMLRPGVMARIAQLFQDGFNEDELVQLVEKGARYFGSAQVVPYAIDPIYLTPLQEWARSNGRTVQELVQDCMSICFENEYFYALNFERRNLPLTIGQYKRMAELLGKEIIFGEDVINFIAGKATQPGPAPEK